MIASVTERGTFRRCRRQWMYSSPSLMSLGSIAPKKSLSLGHTMHAALAQWLQEPHLTLAELFLTQAAEDRRKIEAAYLRQVGAKISDEEMVGFHEGVELGMHIANNYQKKWQTPLFNGFELVQAELNIEALVPGTKHKLSGRLDAIIRKVSTDELFVLEHKTYSSRPRPATLQMNDQFLAYIWLAQQLGLGPVAGIAYDGMWKRPTPPRGSTFDDLFTRLIITRPAFEIKQFGAILRKEVTDMAQLATKKTEATFYPNRRWEGCDYDCSFVQLCTMQSRGEDWLAYRDANFVKMTADKEIEATDE